jgi:signal transduction histidine kinase
MKKSIAILLFVIQILLVFVFENIYSIFKQLEKQEMATIQAKADLMAELIIERFKTDPGAINNQGYFDDIQTKYRLQPSASVMVIDGQEFYIIAKAMEGNRGATFRKKIISTSLDSIRRLNKIFFGMTIVIGIFLIFTGFYLVYLFKKFKDDVKLGQIPPLQDYLKELKNSEIALKGIVQQQQISAAQKEELNKNIINNINAAIILINASSRVDIFTPAAGKMFNQSFAHAKNNELKKVLHQFPEIPDFVEQHRGQKRSSEITAGKQIFRIDLLPVPQIGELLMIKDITEEKMREEINLKNKNFAMLGEMTAFLTHEVRNSLGVILGYTKTIRSDSQKMQKVNNEIRHLSTMMESFMNFARPMEVKKREPVHLIDLLNQLSRERDIPIKVNSQQQDIGLETDPALLKSAFLNLVLNAREAGAGAIEVHIKEDEHLKLWFKDDGGGIDENIREKIWFPFFTTKEKGTGMGLAIVRKIITTLRGDIILEKSDPTGTTFKITFYK